MWGLPEAWRLTKRTGLAAAVIVLTSAQSGPAEPRFGSGHLSSTGIAQLPSAGSEVDVELASYDAVYPQDPLHEAAKRAAVRSVRARGWDVVGDSPLVLRVQVALGPSSALPAPRYPPPRRIAGGSEVPPEIPRSGRLDIPSDPSPIPEADRVPDVYPQVRVPLGRRASPVIANYSVTLTLFRRGQEPLWSATIEAAGEIPEPAVLIRALTEAALASLGTSVERDFVLSCVDEDIARGGICLE